MHFIVFVQVKYFLFSFILFMCSIQSSDCIIIMDSTTIFFQIFIGYKMAVKQTSANTIHNPYFINCIQLYSFLIFNLKMLVVI